jgi:hypothetical protein
MSLGKHVGHICIRETVKTVAVVRDCLDDCLSSVLSIMFLFLIVGRRIALNATILSGQEKMKGHTIRN